MYRSIIQNIPKRLKSTQSTTIATKLKDESNPLTDLFGRFHNYLRISLTEKCNLRCKFVLNVLFFKIYINIYMY